ncbi:MAG: hypothetical protein ABRQ27_08785 [Clostridiaceae bacterium]
MVMNDEEINEKAKKGSFMYGAGMSFLAYLASSFLFFWVSVFRRMAVLKIPFRFDPDVAFAVVIVPMMVAMAWIPLGIITGCIFRKKGNKTGKIFFYIFLVLSTAGLAILFWNLPYI